ncbi:MAG: hypothetical protein OEU26_00040 [Candidatus Tectomicrobia bacterium]|nr:hypothetical protein [Candidatus Tectomicrobia bacterium]
MPRLIVLLAICFGLYIVGIEAADLYHVLRPLPWTDWPPVLESFHLIARARIRSCGPLLPYGAAALMAGMSEGTYWRSRQVWRGYHRSIWQFSGVFVILAPAVFFSWVIALNEQTLWRVWMTCPLLAAASFSLSAGYKASTVR